MSDVQRADDLGRRPGPSFREIVAIALVALVLLFAVVNLEEVTVDLVIGELTMALVFVIAISAMLGFGAGYLIARRGRRNRG